MGWNPGAGAGQVTVQASQTQAPRTTKKRPLSAGRVQPSPRRRRKTKGR
jgi:hypothetical protein